LKIPPKASKDRRANPISANRVCHAICVHEYGENPVWTRKFANKLTNLKLQDFPVGYLGLLVDE
jgi:hypothetical protein